MISICIPIYNTDVNELVNSLIKEIFRSSLTCEIILLDDGSSQIYLDGNRRLSHLQYVNYSELPQNSGRIEARKRLASLAQYDWILFIDADSKIITKNYLSNYNKYCKITNDVIVGGRVYNEEPPIDCSLYLHWKYGRKREHSGKSRFIFMTNNFLIRKAIFQRIIFPIELNGYGHEDTWMGIELKKEKAKIVIIENPILHTGLESAITFCNKSTNALKNLIVLEKLTNKKLLIDHVKIIKYSNIIEKLHLQRLIIIAESIFHRRIQNNLNSCQASLILFDFYRLAYLINIKRRQSLI